MGTRHSRPHHDTKLSSPEESRAAIAEEMLIKDLDFPKMLAEADPAEENESGSDDESSNDDDSFMYGDSDEIANEADEPLDEKELLRQLKLKVIHFFGCNDLKCSNCPETTITMYYMFRKALQEPADRWEKLAKDFLHIGLFEFLQKVMENDDFDDELCFTFLMRLTDKSPKACSKVLETNLHETIVEHLRIETEKKAFDMVRTCLFILYNVIQEEETAREEFRELDIVELVRQIAQAGQEDDELYFLCIIFMSWVINEDENEIIDNDEVFSYLERELKSSLMNSGHRSPGGYKSVEILAAIKKLAVNDANKQRIVESGILRHYPLFLVPNGDRHDEQILAVEGLWSVAMECPEEVTKETSCIESLISLVSSQEVKRDVKIQAIGALSELSGLLNLPTTEATTEYSETKSGSFGASGTPKGILEYRGEGEPPQIFISYNHGSKTIVHKIKDQLEHAGYQVWIDSEKIKGYLTEDICNGIDSSSLVLVCLSQKYHESPYCKKEFQFAMNKSKEVIPLTMEPKYKPQSWLSFHLGDSLRMDFSNPASFEDSWNLLQSRIRHILNGKGESQRHHDPTTGEKMKETLHDSSGGDLEKGKETHHDSCSEEKVKDCSATPAEVKAPEVSSWTETQIQAWLERRSLKKLKPFFKKYDGKMLLEFKSSLLKDAPESTAKDFLKHYSFQYLAKLRMALNHL